MPLSVPPPLPELLGPQGLTSGPLESLGSSLSPVEKQDFEEGHPFPKVVVCTGTGDPGESGVRSPDPDPGAGGLLDVLGVGEEGIGQGAVHMFGFCAAPLPHRAGSRGPTGPKVPRGPREPGPPLVVSEEKVQTAAGGGAHSMLKVSVKGQGLLVVQGHMCWECQTPAFVFSN